MNKVEHASERLLGKLACPLPCCKLRCVCDIALLGKEEPAVRRSELRPVVAGEGIDGEDRLRVRLILPLGEDIAADTADLFAAGDAEPVLPPVRQG